MTTRNTEKFIALTPVRLEDFKTTNSQNSPTPIQVVKHYSQTQLDQTNRSASTATLASLPSTGALLMTGPFQNLADENSPALLGPDWQLLTSEEVEEDGTFPWLPSRPQAVLQVSDGSENFQISHSDDEGGGILSPPIKPPLPPPTTPAGVFEDPSGPRGGGGKVERRHFMCSVCKKTYRLQSSLEKHLQVPCQVRPFKCAICHKAFKRQDHLKAHNRMHTGERPYSCALCGKTFRQKNHLQRHAERKHVNEGEGGEEEGEGVEEEMDENSSDVCGGVEDMEDDETTRTGDQD